MMERRISQFSSEWDTSLQTVRKQFRSTLEGYHEQFVTEMEQIRAEMKCPQPKPDLSHLVSLEVDKRIREIKQEESQKWDGVMERFSKLEGCVKVCASGDCLALSICDMKQFVEDSCRCTQKMAGYTSPPESVGGRSRLGPLSTDR